MSALLVVSLLAALQAAPVSAADPLAGHWILIVDRSTFADAVPQRGERRVRELADGTLYITEEVVEADGNTTTLRSVYRRDGRDHRVSQRGASGTVTVHSERVISTSPYVVECVRKINGAVSATSTEALSPDGRVYTITTRVKNRDGSTRVLTEVWERR